MTDAHIIRGETHREYLGDAVYASFDGYQIWLRTGDGNDNRIALEPPVINALFECVQKLKADAERQFSTGEVT